MAKKWIQNINGGEGPKKGALHREMGISLNKKIPMGKLEHAAKQGGILGKRASLAETFKRMHH